jgi:hypothetical protein
MSLVFHKILGFVNQISSEEEELIAQSLSRFCCCTLLSVVGIATGYVCEDWQVGVESQWGPEFSLLHVVQIGSGAHPASYPIGTVGPFPEIKAAGEWS